MMTSPEIYVSSENSLRQMTVLNYQLNGVAFKK